LSNSVRRSFDASGERGMAAVVGKTYYGCLCNRKS
jgi:hypothetical protein